MEDQDEKNARSLKTMSENIGTISRDVSGLKKEISNFQNTYQVCAEIEFAKNFLRNSPCIHHILSGHLLINLHRA
jgi:hypothetical protein